MVVGGSDGGDDDEVARRRVGRRRWEIECIEPGMEEIRQIMLSPSGWASERERSGRQATQFDGKYKPDSAEKGAEAQDLLILQDQIKINSFKLD